MSLNKERDERFLYCACNSSSIRISTVAIRVEIPSKLLSRSSVKTPALLDEIVRSTLSNWRGEYWSIDSKIFLSYRYLAEYLKDPNCGDFPDFCSSRRWKYCFVKGRTKRFFLRDSQGERIDQ